MSADLNGDPITLPRGSTPVPDPTELTDRAIAKAIDRMTAYIDGKIEVIEAQTEARNAELKANLRERDQLVASLREFLMAKITAGDDLTEEKFAAMERQRIEQKIDTKAAVDAALIAQKEAVKEQTTASERAIAKSEAATTKQLEQQALTVSTVTDVLRRSIDEIKERMTEENRSLRSGIQDVGQIGNALASRQGGAKEDRMGVYAILAIVISTVVGLITITAFILTQTGG